MYNEISCKTQVNLLNEVSSPKADFKAIISPIALSKAVALIITTSQIQAHVSTGVALVVLGYIAILS